MTKHIRRNFSNAKKHPIISRLIIFTAVFLIFKLAMGLGAEAAAEDMLKNLASDPESVTDILRMELGGKSKDNRTIRLLSAQSTLLDEITSITISQDDLPILNRRKSYPSKSCGKKTA